MGVSRISTKFDFIPKNPTQIPKQLLFTTLQSYHMLAMKSTITIGTIELPTL